MKRNLSPTEREMNNEKDKPPSRLTLRKYLIIGLFALILAALINVKLPHDPGRYKVGDIARETIRSASTFILPGTDIEMKKGEVIVREGQKVAPKTSGSSPVSVK